MALDVADRGRHRCREIAGRAVAACGPTQEDAAEPSRHESWLPNRSEYGLPSGLALQNAYESALPCTGRNRAIAVADNIYALRHATAQQWQPQKKCS